VEKPLREFRADVADALRRNDDGWVCDGNYSMVRDLVLPQAEAVVWLRLPFRVTYWRLLKRTLRRAWSKEPLWGTNHESWRMTFFSRDSLLLYAATKGRHAGDRARRLRETIPEGLPLYELRSSREVEQFLGSLKLPERCPDRARR
jgi:adenylate kinase family enzyme